MMARASITSVPHGVAPVEGIAEVALGSSQMEPNSSPPGSNLSFHRLGRWMLEPHPQPSHRNGNGQRAAGSRPGRKTASK